MGSVEKRLGSTLAGCGGLDARPGTVTALLVLPKNLLISREPLYGLGVWAARHDS